MNGLKRLKEKSRNSLDESDFKATGKMACLSKKYINYKNN
jgi:hypothetical protein